MRLKGVGLALLAVAMLAAIVAGNAFGAASTPASSHWIINGTKMATGGSETVSCKVGRHLFNESGQSGLWETKLELRGSLGAGKTPVTMTATGVECLNPAGTEAGKAKIIQTATMAEGEGRVRFTGATVSSPPNCQVKGVSVADPVGTVTTNQLKGQLQEETVEGVTTVFGKVEPAAAGGAFVEIEVSKSGEKACAVSGKYSVKGTAFGEAVKNVEATEKAPTGYEAVEGAGTSSPGIETTAGGTLTLGGNAVTATGRALGQLSGPNAGNRAGAVE